MPGVVVLLNGWTIDWIDKLEVTERGSSLKLLGFECLSVELVRELLSKVSVKDFESEVNASSTEELVIPVEGDAVSLDSIEFVIVNEEVGTLLESLLDMTLL